MLAPEVFSEGLDGSYPIRGATISPNVGTPNETKTKKSK